MEKTNRRIEILCIIALLLIMTPSLDFLVKKAFAEVTIEAITPTGGALGATSDCNDITSGNGIIWHTCNNVIYAISQTTNAVVGSIAITTSTSDSFLASVSGTHVYHRGSGTGDIRKYTFSGSTVTLTGTWTPPCTLSAELQYDELGYLWTVCGTQDQIVRINPNTMTTVFVSQTLDDNVDIDCDSPTRVSYSAGDNIGVIRCSVAPQGIVTFSITNPTTLSLLDDDLDANEGNNNVFVSGSHNKILAFDSTELEVFSFTSGGIMSQDETITVNNDGCHFEPYLVSASTELFAVCIDDSGTNTVTTGFSVNSTDVGQIMNTVIAIDGTNGDKTLGFDIQDRQWYISSNLNDQRYIVISGLVSDNTDPDSPSGEDPNIIGGVDCNLPANENKLICRVTDPIGGAGNFVIGNGTSGITGIGCSIGLVDCTTDTNPRTNGLGLLVFIASIFMVVGMFYITIGRSAFVIPVYIWIVIILALSAFFTITGIIDPIFLILTVVALIALAVPQLQKRFFSSGMGGGSTA